MSSRKLFSELTNQFANLEDAHTAGIAIDKIAAVCFIISTKTRHGFGDLSALFDDFFQNHLIPIVQHTKAPRQAKWFSENDGRRYQR